MASAALIQQLIQQYLRGTRRIPPKVPGTKPSNVPVRGGPGPDPIDSALTLDELGISKRGQAHIEAKELDPTVPASDFDVKPKVFGEGETVGSPSRFGKIEEDDPIRDLVHRDKRIPKGQESVTGSARAREQLDDLFGEETTRQAEDIRKILNAEGVGRDRDIALQEVQKTLALKDVDQMAKDIFEQIQELEGSLTLPKGFSQAEGFQLRDAKKRLQNFKKEAAQAAARARKSGDTTELFDIQERLNAPLKGSQGHLGFPGDESIGRRESPVASFKSDSTPPTLRPIKPQDPNLESSLLQMLMTLEKSPKEAIGVNPITVGRGQAPIKQAGPNISRQLPRPKLDKAKTSTFPNKEFNRFIEDTLKELRQ